MDSLRILEFVVSSIGQKFNKLLLEIIGYYNVKYKIKISKNRMSI